MVIKQVSAAPEVASDVAEERVRQFIERQAARGAAPRGVARLEGPDDDEVPARTGKMASPGTGSPHGPERRETSSNAFPRFGLGPHRLQEWKPVLEIKIQAPHAIDATLSP